MKYTHTFSTIVIAILCLGLFVTPGSAQDDSLDLDSLLKGLGDGDNPTAPPAGGGGDLDDLLNNIGGEDPAPAPEPGGGGGDDLGDLFGTPEPGGGDDLGDLFGTPEPAPPAPVDPIAPVDPVPSPIPPPSPEPVPPPAPAPVPGGGGDDLGDLFGTPTPEPTPAGGGDLDDLFGPPEPSPTPEPLPEPSPTPAPAPGGDPGDLFGTPEPPPSPAPEPPSGGGLDDLFGTPETTPSPAPESPGSGIDDLFGTPAPPSTPPEGEGGLDDLFGTPEPPPAPTGGVDDLFGDPTAVPEFGPGDGGDLFGTEPADPAVDPPAGAGPGGNEVTPSAEQETVGLSQVKKAEILERRTKLLLQEKQRKAMNAYQEAVRLYSRGKWAEAIQKYNQVLEELPDVAINKQRKDLSRYGIADCYFKMAKAIFDDRETTINIGGAVDKLLDRSLTLVPEHEASLQLRYETELWMDKVAREDLLDKDVLSKRKDNVDQLLRKGKELYNRRDYDNAEVLFENVLSHDKYNQNALYFLNKIAEKRFAFHSLEREVEYKQMMDEVRNRWIYRDGPGPQRTVEIETPTEEEEEEDPSDLLNLMEQILIPELSFKDASLYDVVEFLIAASREGDPRADRAATTDDSTEDGAQGVNIIIDLDDAVPTGSAAPAGGGGGGDDFFGGLDGGGGLDGDGGGFGFDAPEGGGGGGGFDDLGTGGGGVPRVTISLRRVNLKDALEFVTDVTNLKYTIRRGTVVIRRTDAIDTPITRFYPVDPNVFSQTGAIGGGGAAADPFGGGGGDPFAAADPFAAGGGAPAGPAPTAGFGQDVTDYFRSLGVDFPSGTLATYQANLGQIIVVNSSENHKKFKAVLDKVNQPPVQVEIEARFVEVQQNELDEFGLEWRLTDDYEVAFENGPGPIGSRPRIQVDQNSSGLTQALRFFNFEGTSGTFEPSTPLTRAENALPIGGILSVSSVLTNPELQSVLHLINQKGSMDLLSAPRITTLSGVNAQIEVVREIIYPTEFEIEQSQFGFGGGGGLGGAGGIGAVTPPTVTPGAFETRETGVILNVTPTVSPDRYTIQLALIPEIAELVEWIQYGSSVGLQDGSSFVFNIPQPIFASRNVTTSMVVWDGHSVVMGGLIREDLVSFDDKIPVLGDIPFVGRLFRSQGERSNKRNLLIFVSARLVNPAGKPINKVKDDLRYRRLSESLDTLE